MTEDLAERAVEVTSKISQSLAGTEETTLLLDNIVQLERYEDFLLLSAARNPDGKFLGPSVMSTGSFNQRLRGTRYSVCCLQKTCSFATFLLTSG
jgi:hypothetical protein